MSDSILTSTKKVLGIDENYTAFDIDVIMHINTVLNTLTDLGIGPEEGFMIEDKAAKWSDFIGDNKTLNAVKTYVCFRVRLAFDPPPTSFAIASLEKQAEELEWRLNVRREGESWSRPEPTTL